MDLVPPGVRGTVADGIVKLADQIRNERGMPNITTDIFAEALRRMADQANMPQNVKDLLPKPGHDFGGDKISIPDDQLSE